MSRLPLVLVCLLVLSPAASAQEGVRVAAQSEAQNEDAVPVTMIRTADAGSLPDRFDAMGISVVDDVPMDVVGPFEAGMTTSRLDSLFVLRAPTVDAPNADAAVARVAMSGSPFQLLLPGPVLLDMAGPVDEVAEKVLAFRAAHPAIPSGIHERLGSDPYTFYRGIKLDRDSDDEVVVSLGVTGKVRLSVSKAFPDDTVVREVLSGQITIVSYGQISLDAGDRGMLLIEVVQ